MVEDLHYIFGNYLHILKLLNRAFEQQNHLPFTDLVFLAL